MNKILTCIECPVSCSLTVDIENCRVVKVSGGKCPKGDRYAAAEIENPARILTATVLAKGLTLKMIPARTDRPIPKAKIMEAAGEIRKIIVTEPISTGGIIAGNLLGLGVNLIATRAAERLNHLRGQVPSSMKRLL